MAILLCCVALFYCIAALIFSKKRWLINGCLALCTLLVKETTMHWRQF